MAHTDNLCKLVGIDGVLRILKKDGKTHSFIKKIFTSQKTKICWNNSISNPTEIQVTAVN